VAAAEEVELIGSRHTGASVFVDGACSDGQQEALDDTEGSNGRMRSADCSPSDAVSARFALQCTALHFTRYRHQTFSEIPPFVEYLKRRHVSSERPIFAWSNDEHISQWNSDTSAPFWE
jgi:hypothetical protein